MDRFLLFAVVFLTTIVAFAQKQPSIPTIKTDTSFIKLYNLKINLVKYTFKPNGIKFLVVHDNENTGLRAGFEYMRWSGGEIIDSQYGGGRNYNFNFMDDPYHIDPNAIYTEIGVNSRLKKDEYSTNEVEKAIVNAGKQIVNFYEPIATGYILTLHNNANGDFGISSYLPGYELSSTADSVYVNANMDPDDLIYVTEARLFASFKKANVNVILQSKFSTNDASLSFYAMDKKIPYINVEVQHGHDDENLRLIEIAVSVLKEFALIKKELKENN